MQLPDPDDGNMDLRTDHMGKHFIQISPIWFDSHRSVVLRECLESVRSILFKACWEIFGHGLSRDDPVSNESQEAVVGSPPL